MTDSFSLEMHIAKVQNHHALKLVTLVHPYTPNMTKQKQQALDDFLQF
jgi:hypothetical protein